MDNIADRRTYGPGDIILREGDSGDSFYLIEKGSVEVYKKGPNGQKIVIGKIPTGGIFGEMAVIDDKPRMASAAAVEPTICRVIPRTMLEKKIASSDKLVQAIIKIFIQNIRTITELQIAKAMGEAGVSEGGEAPAG
jgi:CRP/FNR family cyclic AMP-dependent transcriptional regulator